jgi:peptidoglycan/xylan/chitin deacetylase (PgdA/CDA1 family)
VYVSQQPDGCFIAISAKVKNVVTNGMLDYYRCPEEFSCFERLGDLSENPGYFRFAGSTLFGRTSVGIPSGAIDAKQNDISACVEVRESKCYLPFDVEEAVTNLREERYVAKNNEVGAGAMGRGLVRKAYYMARPFLGVGVRKYLQRLSLRGARTKRFPSWPLDRTVDRLFENLLLRAMRVRGVEKVPFIWFWPDRKSACAMMTHDVETAEGLAFCSRLMDLNDSHEIKSSFQIIPAERYAVPGDLLNEIRERGFEINVHDWNHDGLLYSDHRVFLERVRRINEAAAAYQAEGFRSGVLYRNTDWYNAFNIAYDMSMPNVGHFDPQPGGCCTIMPYFVGQILELPVTTIQDYSLFHICGDYSIDIWKRQIEFIMEGHGLASFIVHPDYVIEKRARATYSMLLEYLTTVRDQRSVWIARPKEVNNWWRERRLMKLIQRPSGWAIEGIGKERACVAIATRSGQGLSYSLQ